MGGFRQHSFRKFKRYPLYSVCTEIQPFSLELPASQSICHQGHWKQAVSIVYCVVSMDVAANLKLNARRYLYFGEELSSEVFRQLPGRSRSAALSATDRT